jgi:hypothetical protein
VTSGDPPAHDLEHDRSPLTGGRRTQRADQRLSAVLDLLEAELPALSDEHVVTLITFLRAAGRRRPHDPRDPWTALLHRDDVELVWARLEGHRGRTERCGTRFAWRILLDTRMTKSKRRAVLAHELAHVALNNGYADDAWPAPEEIRANEARTDAHAIEHCDIDPDELAESVAARSVS